MGTLILILFIFALVSITIGISLMNKQNETRDSLTKIIENEQHTKSYHNVITKTALLYDEGTKNLTLVTGGEHKDTIGYKDILQVELTEDSVSRTRSKRGSQLGGALLGGLAFGVAGGIVGGVTGQKEHSEKVRQIGLRMVVNDTNNPVREIMLHNFGVLRDKDHPEYQKAHSESFEWFKLIEVLIHQADKEDEQKESTAN